MCVRCCALQADSEQLKQAWLSALQGSIDLAYRTEPQLTQAGSGSRQHRLMILISYYWYIYFPLRGGGEESAGTVAELMKCSFLLPVYSLKSSSPPSVAEEAPPPAPPLRGARCWAWPSGAPGTSAAVTAGRRSLAGPPSTWE